MRALINQIIQQKIFPEQLETLVLVGCGRIGDLPEAHRDLASRFVYIEPNPRFAELNVKAVSGFTNSVFVNQAWSTQSGTADFFQFNLPQFDGLISLENLACRAGNLRQLSSGRMSTINATELLNDHGLNRKVGSVAIVFDIGEFMLQILQQDLPAFDNVDQLLTGLPKSLKLPTSFQGWSISFQAPIDFTGQQLVCLSPLQGNPLPSEHPDKDLLQENKVLKEEIQALKERISELENRLAFEESAGPTDYAIQLKQSEEQNRMMNNELLKGFAQIDLLKELMLKDNLP